MDWHNCIEVGQPTCVLVMSGVGADGCRDRISKLVNQMKVTDIHSLFNKMMLRSRVPFYCNTCTFSGSYRTADRKNEETIALHSLAHIAVGGDFKDVLTSPNDPAFFGYHANIDRNNMDWMISTHEELENDYWGYPKSNRDYKLMEKFKVSGPWPLYPALACTVAPRVFDEFVPFTSPWLAGTTKDEVLNSGFPTDNLFDVPPANGWGYTHGESTLS